ncbi:MAG: S41 family peptidase [Longimicrobiales bacterium]
MTSTLLLLAVTLGTGSTTDPVKGTRLLHDPDISADRIVFVYAGDIWTAPVAGGDAARLTNHPGDESSPKFSPDGRWIAFSAEYDGNVDVFVVPAAGGEPRRLTFHPGGDQVLGWTPDGTKVLFRSSRLAFSRFSQFFTVSTEGGLEDLLPIPEGSLGSFSPDGRRIAYTPIANAFGVWKRYRGGRTTPIWLLDLRTHDHVEVPHENASDTWPVWLGDNVFFLSDRDGPMNLFAYDTRSRQVREVASHGTNDIKYLSGGAGKLVYEAEGYIHVADAKGGPSKQVPIRIASDYLVVRPRFKDVTGEIRAFDISPTGQRALFEAHGDILTAPARRGDVRNLTQTTAAYERDPAWSPDGRSIAYLSDESGEYALYIADQLGGGPPRKIELTDPTFFYNPTWSPDSRRIAYSDKAGNLYWLDVASGRSTLVDTEVGRDFDWSTDSKWITYAASLKNRYRMVRLYDVDGATKHDVTDGMSDSYDAVFSRDGQYLFFLASTDVGPTKGGLDLSSQDRPVSWNMYVTVLRADVPSPFAPESDEERPRAQAAESDTSQQAPRGDATPAGARTGTRASRAPASVRIDVANIDQRILAMPLPAGQYSDLQAADGGRLFFRSGNALRRFDMTERRAEDFMTGVSGYAISADGRQLIYRSGGGGGRGGGRGGGGGEGGGWGIVPTAQRPQPNAGRLEIGTIEVMVDPRAEWQQMFREAWRINRDFFYDPGMHGLDWKAIGAQYETWLPEVKHRQDLNYVIGEMLGELSVGHSRVGGGEDSPFQAESVNGGLLGADYEIRDGHYRIRKVYRGLNWNPGLRAPLTEPGVNVKEGEYILRVNGRPLAHPTNIHALLENTVNRQVTLLVSPSVREADGRTVTVVPIGSESNLRNLDWIETNRRKVEELSGGKVGYIYLPNTGAGGYEAFNRFFFAQLDKEGLVIDERYNGGGKAADYVVDYLDRPLLSYWAPRDGPDYTTPFAANFGAKAMIINEYAGSGGDAMPYYFAKRKIGPLVGKRTWGGLVGVGGVPNLLDGGSVSAPSFAIFNEDGEWIIENVGVPPDVEVEQTPKLVNQGHDPQLERAVQLVLDEIRKNPFKATPRPAFPDKTLKLKPKVSTQSGGR